MEVSSSNIKFSFSIMGIACDRGFFFVVLEMVGAKRITIGIFRMLRLYFEPISGLHQLHNIVQNCTSSHYSSNQLFFFTLASPTPSTEICTQAVEFFQFKQNRGLFFSQFALMVFIKMIYSLRWSNTLHSIFTIN